MNNAGVNMNNVEFINKVLLILIGQEIMDHGGLLTAMVYIQL